MSKINATTTGIQNIGDTTPDIEFQSEGVTKVRVKSDGRLYGTDLHNNPGSVTGVTNQYIASGTYTPTLSNTNNITSSTAYLCQWLRVGNVVTVSGKVLIDITTTLLLTRLGISLPIPSVIAADNNLCGVGAIQQAGAGSLPFILFGDTGNARATLEVLTSAGSGNNTVFFTFTYLVL